MAQKSFYTKCFNEWKSGIITSPILETCKSIKLDGDLSKHEQLFYTIKNAEVFKSAFQHMTDVVFEYGVRLEYVAVLLAFCFSLDEKMLQMCDWYNTELLIDALHTALLKVKFDPTNFHQRAKVNNNNCYKFLTIVPVLLFCYYLERKVWAPL